MTPIIKLMHHEPHVEYQLTPKLPESDIGPPGPLQCHPPKTNINNTDTAYISLPPYADATDIF